MFFLIKVHLILFKSFEMRTRSAAVFVVDPLYMLLHTALTYA